MKLFVILCSSVHLLAGIANAKSLAPKEIAPITTENAIYSAPHFGFENGTDQNGGVILAHDPKTHKLLWRVQVYKTVYDPNLAKDVQDVFIKSITYDKNSDLLIVVDGKARIYVIRLATQKVTLIE